MFAFLNVVFYDVYSFSCSGLLSAGNRHCEITFVVKSFEIVTYWEKLQKKFFLLVSSNKLVSSDLMLSATCQMPEVKIIGPS